jgi:hypothetical protein
VHLDHVEERVSETDDLPIDGGAHHHALRRGHGRGGEHREGYERSDLQECVLHERRRRSAQR